MNGERRTDGGQQAVSGFFVWWFTGRIGVRLLFF